MSETNSGLFIEPERLEAFGENTARRLAPAGTLRGARAARPAREALARLGRAHDGAERAARSGQTPPAAVWLLDNWYLAAREGRGAAAALAGGGPLRACGGAALLGEAAAALVRAGQGRVDKAHLTAFFTGFQRALPLTRRELSLLPAALRAALAAWLAQAAEDLAAPGAEAAMAAGFGALRWLSTADLAALLEEIDLTEAILRRDPAGVYPLMDERSRDLYRRRVTALARRRGTDEQRLARQVLALAGRGEGEGAHVGHWLFTRPLGLTPRRRGAARYMAAQLLGTLFFALLGGFWARELCVFLLLLLPVSELVKALLDTALLRLLPPRLLPRLALEDGLPPEGRTLCVVSCLLTAPESAAALAARLEEFRLASRDCGGELRFGLLADLPEAQTRSLPADAPTLEAARAAVDGLNAKYGGGFYLFCRRRTLHARDGRWMGRERKRGALCALAALLRGAESELHTLAGDGEALRGTRYILTLDADTRLPPGAARELVGAMLHPLNRPVVDEARRAVTRGHGVLHPRMAVEPQAAARSLFTRAFAGQGGVDPYGSACGELWMDLCGRGGFAGKGVLDVDAFLACCADLPAGRILSHDAVEGALLRGGYLSDTELLDGFPGAPLGYFRRLHRWTRGDWQNLPFLLSRRLCDADRWKLADSLRRSLVAPGCLAALTAALLLPGPGTALCGAAAVLALGFQLLPEGLAALLRRERARPFAPLLHGFSGALRRVLLRLALLPWEAFTCLGAALCALWRLGVSGKNLLLWQPAAQGEGAGAGLRAWLRAVWAPVLLGYALLLLSPTVLGRTAGFVWHLCPLLAQAAARPARPRPLPAADRAFLLAQAGRIWAYFDDFLTPENRFLPPDNWQAQPPLGAAPRTSPTNIGLALVSCLAAADLGLAAPEDALGRVEGALGTLEALPKWRGHLYNWYDTDSLRPLSPAYVSTVDSGNLAACLLALAAGLREYGRDGLAARAAALYDAMDFRPLYDERRLLRIGYDAAAGKLSEGVYDLLASEARLTGYLAVARGDLPRRHWRQLSRALLRFRGRRGLASWTGTMFEYLMPELFLPLCPDSLLAESARFCLFVQRREAPAGGPWGQSESAFFALDPSLAYRYKAHGCAPLALRRGMGADLVVAPYAAFLALAVSPRAAVRDLRRFEALGAAGRYGLWEALDFTPARCRLRGGEAVRCVMAHHLGMSLAAVANCLLDGVMRRRFLADPAMRAFAPLLAERAPLGGVALRRRGGEPPEKPRRAAGAVWAARGEAGDAARPAVCLLSNGVYHLALTDTGLSWASAGGLALYRAPEAPLSGPAGLRLYLETDAGRIDLLPLPGAAGGLAFSHAFSGAGAQFTGEGEALRSRAGAAVAAADTCEARLVELEARRALSGRLVLEFEPALARPADYANHPAFWKLGLHAAAVEGALLLRRLPRGETPACCLCLAADRPMALSANAGGAPLGWLDRPLVRAELPLELAPGARWSARFALAFGGRPEEALDAARRGLTLGPADAADLLSAQAARLGLGARDVALAMETAAALAFPRAAGTPREGRDALWRLGVSGDEPVVCCAPDARTEPDALRRAVARHALLRACGLRADLVFLTAEGGDYARPLARAVSEALARLGLEALAGAPGGVHVARADHGGAVREAAALRLGPDGLPEGTPPRGPARPYPPLPARRLGGDPACRWLEDGAFSFTVEGRLPRRAWCQILTNGGMGCLALDYGPGYMWQDNAREGRLTRWVSDELAAVGDETLACALPEGPASLFAAEDGLACRVEYGPGYALWEKLGCRVTLFVPPGTDARVLLVEGAARPLLWRCGLTLAAEARDARFAVTAMEDGLLTARNAWGAAPARAFRAAFSAPPAAWTCDLAAWLRGEPGGEAGAGLLPCFAARLEPAPVVAVVCGCAEPEALRRLARPEAALLALEETRAYWTRRACRLRVTTPDARLNRYLNFWCVYQTLACRLLARSGLYQSGGAYGFRDQLQDAVNLLPLEPDLARRRILDACRHQYTEGDVLHWWHPQPAGDRGVRTRCADDLVWLPWAVCEYVEGTGDAALLDEETPWLSSPPLREGEASRYEAPAATPEAASVLAHAARALALVLARGAGAHGLPLMGAGDWNDGMDAVGRAGRGESVWLGWFFAHTARRFAALLDKGGAREDAAALLSAARRFGQAADRAWDGGWYLRGWYDDGAPLGGQESRACRIDSIAQSWAFLCAEAGPERREAALDAALARLFGADGVARLFTPPFTPETEQAGYIGSYGPGFRENGGQYTHGALWLALACFRAGRREAGLSLLRACLPRETGDWGAEPFVLAADVYADPDRLGEAGWSWYTGSAGWFFRVACRELLGLRLENGRLSVSPEGLPPDWAGWDGVWTDAAGAAHVIHVTRAGVTVDGEFTNFLPFRP